MWESLRRQATKISLSPLAPVTALQREALAPSDFGRGNSFGENGGNVNNLGLQGWRVVNP